MALIENLYVGDGSTVLYSFTFPYIEESDVKVSLDGTDTTAYSLANATTVEFTTAPASGVAIRIYRDTSVDNPKAIFYPGSAIRAQDLNDNFEQNLFVIQEADFNNGKSAADSAAALVTAQTAETKADQANVQSAAAEASAATANTNATQAAADAAQAQAGVGQAASDAAAAQVSADQANAAVQAAAIFAPVSNVAAIPASPSDQDRVSVLDSTGIAGFTPLTGLPVGPVYDSGSFVNLIYRQAQATWEYVAYGANDPDARYLLDAPGTVSSTNLTPDAVTTSSYTYPGGVLQILQTRLGQFVSVKDFGAVGDGTTDDTAAIQAALNSATDKVIVPYGQYLANSADIDIPVNTSLVVLGATALDTTSRYTVPQQTTLILGNDKTINLNNNSGLGGLSIVQETTYRALENLQQGETLTIADVNNYSGTAIIANACAYVGYCNIFGFNQGIKTLTGNTPRGRLEYLTFDCINGVEIDHDLGGWDLYSCHAYAVLTVGDDNNIRSGVGFKFKNYSDWTYVTNCFSFYDIGFRIEDCNSIKFMGCGADHPRSPKGTVGFDIQGSSWGNLFIGCQAASHTIGLRSEAAANNRNMLTGCAAWSCDTGVRLSSGNLNVSGTVLKDITNTGIVVDDAASKLLVDGCQFQDMPTAISTPAYSEVLTSNNEYTGNIPTVRSGEVTKALTLTSTNLALPYNDTLLEINSGSQSLLGTLIGATRDPGSILTLKFNNALILSHSSSGLNLAGSVNASMTPGSTITLVYVSGNTWYELSRSIA